MQQKPSENIPHIYIHIHTYIFEQVLKYYLYAETETVKLHQMLSLSMYLHFLVFINMQNCRMTKKEQNTVKSRKEKQIHQVKMKENKRLKHTFKNPFFLIQCSN